MQTKIQYFLDKTQEEAAEIVQAVSKIRRFGPDHHHPDRTTTNKQEFVGELEDLLALVAALEHTGFIDLRTSQQNIAQKLHNLVRP